MRQLKFRVWDKINSEWFNPEETNDGAGLTLNGEIAYCSESQFGHINPSNNGRFSVQQFTGFLDKNGVEAYEGDIVEYEQTNGFKTNLLTYIGMICLHGAQSYYGVGFAGGSKGDINPMCFDYSIKITIKIIGNIFENPELLPRIS